MSLYVSGMYEGLYLGVLILSIQDTNMSECGHIVYKYNRNTVQREYTKNGG